MAPGPEMGRALSFLRSGSSPMTTDEEFAKHIGLYFAIPAYLREEIEPLLARLPQELADRVFRIVSAVYRSTDAARADYNFVFETSDVLGELAGESFGDSLREELGEILDNLEWVVSDAGRMRRAVLGPILDFKRKFAAATGGDRRFDGILIGGHINKPVIFVSGVLDHEDDRKALETAVRGIEAAIPVEIEIVRVGAQKK